jgi:transcriptional regulator with XRE-family HTH domain
MIQEEIKQIAARIKELREIFEVPEKELAAELGINLEQYLKYESGDKDIPVGILSQIAQRFGVELSTLLTGREPRLHTYCLTRKDKGVSVERRKDYKYLSLAYNFVNKKAEPFLVTVEPVPDNTPISLNTHPGQEFNYVLEGSLKIVLGKHEVILNEGDSLYFDSSIEHGMQALQGAAARFLAIIF